MIAAKSQSVAEQGHITDRISKAVEQLGAERTVDRIGRPVSIWTGKPVLQTLFGSEVIPPDLPPRTRVLRYYRDYLSPPGSEPVEEGFSFDISTWPSEVTRLNGRRSPSIWEQMNT